jgi:outer membrane receptor for monomeric catechols
MPLEFDESPAVYDFARNAVMFTAMNGRRLVRFRVTNHALASMAKCRTGSESEMLAAYKSNAEQIHQIAARKFGQRLVDTDGTVLIIERDIDPLAAPGGSPGTAN